MGIKTAVLFSDVSIVHFVGGCLFGFCDCLFVCLFVFWVFPVGVWILFVGRLEERNFVNKYQGKTICDTSMVNNCMSDS